MHYFIVIHRDSRIFFLCDVSVAFFRDAMLLSLLALSVGVVVASLEESMAPRWLVGLAVWLRGRGGRPGHLLLGEDMDTDRKDTSVSFHLGSKNLAFLLILEFKTQREFF